MYLRVKTCTSSLSLGFLLCRHRNPSPLSLAWPPKTPPSVKVFKVFLRPLVLQWVMGVIFYDGFLETQKRIMIVPVQVRFLPTGRHLLWQDVVCLPTIDKFKSCMSSDYYKFRSGWSQLTETRWTKLSLGFFRKELSAYTIGIQPSIKSVEIVSNFVANFLSLIWYSLNGRMFSVRVSRNFLPSLSL